LSCLVLSCLVLSCLVLSCLVSSPTDEEVAGRSVRGHMRVFCACVEMHGVSSLHHVA